MMYAAAGQSFCYLIITVLLRYNELPGYSGSKEVASASVAFFFLYYVSAFPEEACFDQSNMSADILRHWFPGRSVAVSNRNKLTVNENKGRGSRDRVQLGI